MKMLAQGKTEKAEPEKKAKMEHLRVYPMKGGHMVTMHDEEYGPAMKKQVFSTMRAKTSTKRAVRNRFMAYALAFSALVRRAPPFFLGAVSSLRNASSPRYVSDRTSSMRPL